jgi:AcrR family transcriptional regulator
MSAGERRDALLAAAGPLFAAHGYAATRLDEVAAAAGVTKPIVYRHFSSKRELYLALLARHRDDLPTFFAGVEPAPGETLVRAILARWFDYVRANQHAWLMLFRDSGGDAEVQRVRAEVSLRAREVLAAFVAARAGERIPPAQVEATAELLVGGLASLALWWIDHPDEPKQRLVDVAARICEPLLAEPPA